uniref:G-protein coupled receptors family 1 profile domain-containing protein n=1 Tax=Salvator merianae TaxID=96440 RepID=A0A8D0DKM5_SALMN
MNISSENNATQCQPQQLHVAIPVLLAIFSMGGFIFNSISLWIFWFVIKRWNSGIMLQFNLALADAIILPVCPLMVTYFSLGNHWPFGEFLCQVQVFLLSTHLYGSIYFLMLISVHRYQAIVHYSSRSLWRKKSFLKKLALVVWVLLFLQGLPLFFYLKTSVSGKSVKCLSIHQSEMIYLYLILGIILAVCCFLLPFMVSLTSYVMLGMHVAKINQASLQGRVMKTRSIQMVTVALVIFAICFAPLHVFRTVGTIVKYYRMSCELLRHIEMGYYISLVLTMMNCCLDPFIYNFANEKFHKSFSHALRKWSTSA